MNYLEIISKQDGLVPVGIDNKILLKEGVSNEALQMYTLLLFFTTEKTSGVNVISFNLLNEFFLKEAFNKTKKRNLDKIKSSFIELVDKEYIKLSYTLDLEKLKDNEGIVYSINETSGGESTEFHISEFVKLKDTESLKIYLTIKAYQSKNNKPFRVSYENWAKILEVSRGTAIRYIEQAGEKGLINIIYDYDNDNQASNTNRYTIN